MSRKTPLTEDDLNGGVAVLWRGKKYITGNRRHQYVDLRREDGSFVRIVRICSVNICVR